MSSTQLRLDQYLNAEARILTAGFSVRYDIRQRQEADLAEIRKAITALEQQLARETGSGRGSLRYQTAVFNGPGRCSEGFER